MVDQDEDQSRTPETMGFVDQACYGDFVSLRIVLQASVEGGCVDICIWLCMVGVGDFCFGEKRAIGATLPLAASSFWKSDLEKQIVGGDRRGQQALSEGIVWAQ